MYRSLMLIKVRARRHDLHPANTPIRLVNGSPA
jgi:hypothetical protein